MVAGLTDRDEAAVAARRLSPGTPRASKPNRRSARAAMSSGQPGSIVLSVLKISDPRRTPVGSATVDRSSSPERLIPPPARM